MAKGLCCAAQAAGDLGKPLIITVHHKDGTTTRRCGVCEVVPSCRDQSKLVFAFRFLKSMVCGIPGAKQCVPTAAGITEYRAQVPLARAGRELLEYTVSPSNVFSPGRVNGVPYTLPPQ
jgi:hypothetical protein